jgi:branched-chain amino acid aminotransferase
MTDAQLAQGAAWMHGQIIPISEAKIGVTDWGLTHSDIAYDVVPVVDGAFFRLPHYLTRFLASIEAGYFDIGMDVDAIRTTLHDMVAATGLRDVYCAMVAARGTPLIPGNRDPRTCQNHYYAWAVPYVHVIKPEVIEAGASVWIAKDVRRIPPDSVNPRAKNYHWGDFTAGLFEAKEQGYETVLLCNHAGHVTEGPGFNAFAVRDGTVVTPETGVLEGITRRTVLDMCAEMGIPTEIRPLPLDEFMEADEVFLSSSGGGVLPITRVDDRIFGNGKAGPVAQALHDLYWAWTKRPAHRTEIRYF